MKQRDLAIILVPIFILTIFWVIFNVYHSYVNSTIKFPVLEQIVPIQGTFDTNTIEQIKTRTRVNPTDEIITEISGTPTPTPSANEETATLSAQPKSVPTVTP